MSRRRSRRSIEQRLDALEAEQSGGPTTLAEMIMAEATDREEP